MYIHIQKIKLDKNNKPTISIERWYSGGSTEESVIKGYDSWDELTESLQALIRIFCDVCRLSDEWYDHAKVSGLILKPFGDEDGFQIMGQLRVEAPKSAYVVNMSGVFLAMESLTDGDKKLIKAVAAKAKEYVNRLPEQGELDLAA